VFSSQALIPSHIALLVSCHHMRTSILRDSLNVNKHMFVIFSIDVKKTENV